MKASPAGAAGAFNGNTTKGERDMAVDTQKYDPSRMGRKIGREEARRLQLEMLDALAAYCDANGLVYYLSGGTLLGAVRHGGYIPWDDDIDVNMPRPDYERLVAMTGGRLGDHLEIAAPEGPITHSTSFPRLLDTRYVLMSCSKDGRSPYYTNLFIDIFPIEGLPADPKRARWHYVWTKSMIVMRKLAYFHEVPTGPVGLSLMLRHMAKPFAKLLGYRFWNRRLLDLAKRYRYEDCEYVGVVTGYVHTMEEYIRKEGYGTPVRVMFEGRSYNAPADTDRYLRNLYGNYMELPPEDKREAHFFDIWEIKEG